MIRQKTIIKRMILKTALSLLFVAICCYLLCAASTLTQTLFGPARHRLKGELLYHLQSLWTFEPHVVLIKKTSNNQNQPIRLLQIRSNIISVLDRALY